MIIVHFKWLICGGIKMISWENISKLNAYIELKNNNKRVNLQETMTGENGAAIIWQCHGPTYCKSLTSHFDRVTNCNLLIPRIQSVQGNFIVTIRHPTTHYTFKVDLSSILVNSYSGLLPSNLGFFSTVPTSATASANLSITSIPLDT